MKKISQRKMLLKSLTSIALSYKQNLNIQPNIGIIATHVDLQETLGVVSYVRRLVIRIIMLFTLGRVASSVIVVKVAVAKPFQ
jgi:hypothetical protein